MLFSTNKLYIIVHNFPGVLANFITQVVCNLPTDEEPLASSAIGNLSRYHDQVVFINNFLLSAGFINKDYNTTIKQNNSVADIKLFLNNFANYFNNNNSSTSPLKDNNTTNTKLPIMSMPAVFSSVTDTIPGHPRIPRGSPSERKRRRPHQHRHSTRVYIGQPIRFLLPPFENPVPQTFTSPYSIDPVIITSPSFTQTTNKGITGTKEEGKVVTKENLQNNASVQYRKVFIPPPLRFLLPPFFYENYINAQTSTSQTPSLQETSLSPYSNDYYNTNNDLSTSSFFDQNNVSSSSLAPIIIIETISEDGLGKEIWNQKSGSNIEYTTVNTIDLSYTKKKESEINNISPTDIYPTQSTTDTVNSNTAFEFTPQFGSYKTKASDKFSSKTSEQNDLFNQKKYFSDTTFNNDRLNTNQENELKSEPNEKYATRSTLSPLIPSPTSTFRTLSGPNVEQTLFETGNFHSFETAMNESDKTMYMMIKPLLSQEVAEAGMKITVNMKEEMVKNKKFSRGKLKYRHLNQFNFETPDIASSKETTSSKSSQLLVAETSYYNNRRRNKDKQLNQKTGWFYNTVISIRIYLRGK